MSGIIGIKAKVVVLATVLGLTFLGGVGLAKYAKLDEEVRAQGTATRGGQIEQRAAPEHADSLGDPLPPGALARLGTTRLKHLPGFVDDSIFGRKRASAARLRTIISRVAFSPDGKFVASVDWLNGNIRLWDAASGRLLTGPWGSGERSHKNQAIAFSADGKILAAGGAKTGQKDTSVVVLWNISQRKEIGNLEISPGPKTNRNDTISIAFADDNKTLVKAAGGIVYWWDVATAKKIRSWKVFDEAAEAVKTGVTRSRTFVVSEISPGARFLVLEPSWIYSPADTRVETPTDYELMVFDLGSEKHAWSRAGLPIGFPIGYGAFAFSADGKRVAFQVDEEAVELRDLMRGKLLGTAPFGPPVSIPAVRFLALNSDGNTLAIASSTGLKVTLWKAADGVSPRSFVARGANWDSQSSTCLAFSPDDRTLVAAVDMDLQCYDVATLKEVVAWDGHRGPVDHVEFSPDGKRLMSASGELRFNPQERAVWDVASGKRLQISSRPLLNQPNIGTLADSYAYFIGKQGEGRFGLYDVTNGKQLGRFEAPDKRPVQSHFFLPGSKYFVMTANESDPLLSTETFVYEVPSCRLVCRLPSLPYLALYRPDWAPLVFSSDGRLVAMFDWRDGRIAVFEAATGHKRQSLGWPTKARMAGEQLDFQPGALALSPDGKLLASWSPAETVVHVWDVQSGAERLALVPFGDWHEAVRFAWSPDGRVLATGDQRIQLWEIGSGKARREFTGHEGEVRALAFSPDGKLLASGGADTTVLIWEVWGK